VTPPDQSGDALELSRPLLSRRTTLATGLGAAGLAAVTGAGCSVRVPGSEAPTPTPTPRPGRREPDAQAVVDLVDAFRRSVALLDDSRRQHPRLAPGIAPLVALERAHLAVLRKAAPPDSLPKAAPTAPAVPDRVPASRDQVIRMTETLREVCYAAAGRADSGAFARLLAGMGAALSQRLVVIRATLAEVTR
jgi:hypothetical protein